MMTTHIFFNLFWEKTIEALLFCLQPPITARTLRSDQLVVTMFAWHLKSLVVTMFAWHALWPQIFVTQIFVSPQ